ncbi:MAG: hypothetical protein HY538_04440 [Deltaproteobacteria bacterium]|nr:hypothetical protein [Deltaproteobacteria bacterium]
MDKGKRESWFRQLLAVWLISALLVFPASSGWAAPLANADDAKAKAVSENLVTKEVAFGARLATQPGEASEIAEEEEEYKELPLQNMTEETPPGPESAPLSSMQVSTNVDSHTGSANASVPIKVPAGRGRIEPKLSLVYNSGGADTLLGPGWSMPIGTITRRWDRMEGLQYREDVSFVTVIGGKSDTLYPVDNRTTFISKVEDLSKYYLASDSLSWEVTDKSGTRYIFDLHVARDGDDDSASSVSDIYKWYLTRIEDLKGNYLRIEYTRDRPSDDEFAEEFYPVSIYYTGHSDDENFRNRVDFVYERRPEQVLVGDGGDFRLVSHHRLVAIEVYSDQGNELLWKYELEYQAGYSWIGTRLKSVRMIGANPLDELPPVTFTYYEFPIGEDGMPRFVEEVGGTWPGAPTTGYLRSHRESGRCVVSDFVDLNCDKLTDYVEVRGSECPYDGNDIKGYEVLSWEGQWWNGWSEEEIEEWVWRELREDYQQLEWRFYENNGEGFEAYKVFESPTSTKREKLYACGDCDSYVEVEITYYLYTALSLVDNDGDELFDVMDINGDSCPELVASGKYTNRQGWLVYHNINRNEDTGGVGFVTNSEFWETPDGSVPYISRTHLDEEANQLTQGFFQFYPSDPPEYLNSEASTPYWKIYKFNVGEETYDLESIEVEQKKVGPTGMYYLTARGAKSVIGGLFNFPTSSSLNYVVADYPGEGDGSWYYYDRDSEGDFSTSAESFEVPYTDAAAIFQSNDSGQTHGLLPMEGRNDDTPDYVTTTDDQGKATTTWTVYINMGVGSCFGKYDPAGGTEPLCREGVSFQGPGEYLSDYKGVNLGAAFEDLDRSGISDYVVATTDGWTIYRDLKAPLDTAAAASIGPEAHGVSSGTLYSVNNGLGGVTSFQYTPSSQFTNANSDGKDTLSVVFPVVTEVKIEDGFGNSYVRTFDYEGGYFYQGNEAVSVGPGTVTSWVDEFRGFQKVRETDPEGKVTETRFYQGRKDGATSNERDYALQGQVVSQTVKDSSGRLVSQMDHEWELATFQGGRYPRFKGKTSWIYDESGGSRKRKVSFVYDAYGNVVKMHDHGNPDSNDGDEFSECATYYTPDLESGDPWILDRKASSWTQEEIVSNISNACQGSTGRLNERVYLYDLQEPWEGDLPNLSTWDVTESGNLSEEFVHLVDSTSGVDRWIGYRYNEYDEYGNLVDMWDARENRTHIVYVYFDTLVTSVTEAYETEEAYTTYYEYSERFNEGTGLASVEEDPNGARVETDYDTLGRVIETRRGTYSTTYSTERIEYNNLGVLPGTHSSCQSRPESPPVENVNRSKWIAIPSDEVEPQGSRWWFPFTKGIQSVMPKEREECQNVRKEVVDNVGGGTTWEVSYFDGMGRGYKAVKPSDQGMVKSVVEFDLLGRVSQRSVPVLLSQALDLQDSRLWMKMEYDDFSRVKVLERPSPDYSVAERFEVSHKGYEIKIKDAGYNASGSPGMLTKVKVNSQGRPVEVRECFEESCSGVALTQYKYHAVGGLKEIKVTPYESSYGTITTQFTYDSLGRRVVGKDPNQGTWSYKYDDSGNIVRRVDAKGNIWRFEYDARNRLDRRFLDMNDDSAPDGAVVDYQYDTGSSGCYSQSRLTAIVTTGSDNDHSISYCYDRLGRVALKTRTLSDGSAYGFAYAYNGLDQVTQITYPSWYTVQYEYDDTTLQLKRVKSALDNQLLVEDIKYNERGGVAQIDYGNGTTTMMDYEEGSQRTEEIRVDRTSDSAKLLDLVYQYYASGDVKQTKETASSWTENFYYDGYHRLIQATRTDQGNPTHDYLYDYDSIGNMIQNTAVTTGEYHYEDPNHPHAVTSIDNSYDFDYDDNGNLVSKFRADRSVGTNYGWDREEARLDYVWSIDYENKLSDITYFYYHADGQRVKVASGDAISGQLSEVLTLEGLYEEREGEIIHHVYMGSQKVAEVTIPQGTDLRATSAGIISNHSVSWFFSHWDSYGWVFFLFAFLIYFLVLWMRRRSWEPMWAFRVSSPLRRGVASVLVVMLSLMTVAARPVQQDLKTQSSSTRSSSAFEYQFFHSDRLGSTMLVTDFAGEVLQKISYEPYGKIAFNNQPGGIDVLDKYIGARLDPTGLYYLQNRYYDPEIGRFISPDPISYEEGMENVAKTTLKSLQLRPQLMNRFSYAGNNPITFSDPSGLFIAEIIAAAIWLAGLIAGAASVIMLQAIAALGQLIATVATIVKVLVVVTYANALAVLSNPTTFALALFEGQLNAMVADAYGEDPLRAFYQGFGLSLVTAFTATALAKEFAGIASYSSNFKNIYNATGKALGSVDYFAANAVITAAGGGTGRQKWGSIGISGVGRLFSARVPVKGLGSAIGRALVSYSVTTGIRLEQQYQEYMKSPFHYGEGFRPGKSLLVGLASTIIGTAGQYEIDETSYDRSNVPEIDVKGPEGGGLPPDQR